MEDMKGLIYKISKIIAILLMAITLLSGAVALLCGIRFQEAFMLTGIAFGAVAYLLDQKKKKMEALRQIRINEICSQIQAYIADSVSNGQWISGIPKSSAKTFSFQSTDHSDIHQVNILIGVHTENRQALTSEDALLLQEIIQNDMNELYSGVIVRKPYYDSTLEWIPLEVPVW